MKGYRFWDWETKQDPDYSMTTVTATYTPNKCKHDKGWYHTIEFWIFSKRIFVCEKCFTVLDAKRKKVL